MKKSVYFLTAAMLFVNIISAQKSKTPATDTANKEAPKKASIEEKVKSCHKYEGLFTLYQDTTNGSLQMYVKKDQLGKSFIYQSFSMGGPTSLFLNQNMIRVTWLFKIQKSFDKIEFHEQNTNFYYDTNNAVSKAANVDVAAAVFYSEKSSAEDSNGYLIPIDGLLLGDKLDPVKPFFLQQYRPAQYLTWAI